MSRKKEDFKCLIFKMVTDIFWQILGDKEIYLNGNRFTSTIQATHMFHVISSGLDITITRGS